MERINVGKPIDISLIKCCSCGKGYEIKGNLYQNKDTILVCPHCGLKHKINFKLFGKRIENLKKIDRLNLAAIDIGNEAINRNNQLSIGKVRVDQKNPANASGTITSIDMWTVTAMTGAEVATFYVVSGNNLSTRDNEIVQIDGQDPGVVPAGSKQTFTVDLNVQQGDYIGFYATTGGLEVTDDDAEGGIWSKVGDYIPCENETFDVFANLTMSIYGTGTTVVSDFEYAGTGSFVFSGTATQTYTFNYTSSGTGSLTFSGSAVIVLGFIYSGSGSLAYSGTAAAYVNTRHYLYTTSGTLTLSGAGSYVLGFTYSGSGQLTYSGTATQSFTFNYISTGSGNFTFSGTYLGGWFKSGWFEKGWFTGVGVLKDFVYTATGELVYSGGAVQSYTFNYSCTASGSLLFSGTGTHIIGFSRVGSGTYSFSSGASYSFGLIYVSSGELIYSGNAIYSYTIEEVNFIYVGVGNFLYSGIATTDYTYYHLYTGDGVFVYSGSALVPQFNFLYTGSGILVYLGESEYHYCYSYVKIFKDVSIYIKVDKDTSTYTKINKEIANYKKIERGC